MGRRVDIQDMSALRRCCICEKTKRASMFYRYRYTTGAGNLSIRFSSKCTICSARERSERREWVHLTEIERLKLNKYRREWVASKKKKLIESGHKRVTHKRCTNCGQLKVRQEFYSRLENKDGLNVCCRSCIQRQTYAYRTKYKDRHKVWTRNTKLRKYGLERDQYEKMLEAQDGLCTICLKAPACCVDHDHKTGRVRGILCGKCNLALGNVLEDSDIALNLKRYIDEICKSAKEGAK